VGGILLVRTLGVSSLAIGTVAGAFFGPFLLNAVFARRAGTRYTPILDWHDEGLREWVRLSLPLIIGVSLVTADNWIIAHFASATSGAVSLMSYAKQLFTAPMAVLAQAAGAASMPFFASLWSKERHYEFATGVADSVSRVAALGLLASSGMAALAVPLVELIFLGGRFSSADSRECAVYFAVFSVSMFLWSAQAIYSRAFFAAGNTMAPWGWPLPLTSASRCKLLRSPSCCTGSGWSRWPAWTTAKWADASWPRWPAAQPSGCCLCGWRAGLGSYSVRTRPQ
jgi:putative peptidoglycan lipid II flippase